MKILFVTNMYPSKNMPYYGIFIKEQIEAIQSISDNQIDIFFINAKEKGKFEYLKSIWLLVKKIRKDDYAVIHIHYGLSALFLIFIKPSSKVFLTLHGGDILPAQGKYFQILITKLILKRINKVFLQNEEMTKFLKKKHIPCDIIPCGIDTDFFNIVNENITKPENRKIIVFPGDIENKIKNYPLFIRIIERLKLIATHWEIEIKTIQNLTRPMVRDLLNSADCLLMTSVSEGSPQIVKEALSCNLPVVSVNVGDVDKILSGIPNSYISHSCDPIEMSNYLYMCLSAPKENIRENFIIKSMYQSSWVARRIISEYHNSINVPIN